MKAKEIIARQQASDHKEMYIQLQGNFWHVYGGAANAVHRATGYKLRRLKGAGCRMLGFPAVGLAGVVQQMERHGMTVQPYDADAKLVIFSGGDISDVEDVAEEACAGACSCTPLHQQLLAINLADPALTLEKLRSLVRDMQMECLKQMK